MPPLYWVSISFNLLVTHTPPFFHGNFFTEGSFLVWISNRFPAVLFDRLLPPLTREEGVPGLQPQSVQNPVEEALK